MFGAAARPSRILVGVPARQPELVAASRKSDGGAAEGSNSYRTVEMCKTLGFQVFTKNKK